MKQYANYTIAADVSYQHEGVWCLAGSQSIDGYGRYCVALCLLDHMDGAEGIKTKFALYRRKYAFGDGSQYEWKQRYTSMRGLHQIVSRNKYAECSHDDILGDYILRCMEGSLIFEELYKAKQVASAMQLELERFGSIAA